MSMSYHINIRFLDNLNICEVSDFKINMLACRFTV